MGRIQDLKPGTRIRQLRVQLDTTILQIADVFVTEQWGGWAYKVPGPGGNRSKPKLLAFVHEIDEGKALGIEFKLKPPRADLAIGQNDWLRCHPWKNLGPAGWLTARLTRKRQLKTLAKFIAESRSLLPEIHAVEKSPAVAPESQTAWRIDSIMRAARDQGWQPADSGDFD